MRPHSISVPLPLLSSVFRPALWSGLLLFLSISPARPEVAPELRTERRIGPGVKWITIIRSAGPWLIRVIEADGASGYIRPGATFASERGLRAAPLSGQAEAATRETRYPIAGVNGDFFSEAPGPFEADPVGALVVAGEVISTPYPRSAFLIGADGRYAIRRLRLAAWVERPDRARVALKGVNQPCGAHDLVLYTPRFGLSTHSEGPGAEAALTGLELPIRLGTTNRARIAAVGLPSDAPIPAGGVVLSGHGGAAEFLRGLKVGDEVQLRLAFDPPVAADTDVVGGGPALVRDGRVVVMEDTEGFKADVVAGRAPRTAIGFNGRRLMLVTVDGREPGVSAGMTLVELAGLMRDLGCTDAMNLDGGGSTTAWVRGTVVNHPSTGHERRVAEGLFLFSTAPKGPPVRLIVAPEEIAILAGASCPLAAAAEDKFYNPLPAPSGPVTWHIEPDLGVVDADGRFRVGDGATETGDHDVRVGVVRVGAGKLTGNARLRVYSRPPRLGVGPPAAVLQPGATQQFSARALDEWGRPLIAAGVPVRWSCPPELGQVDETGLFRAAAAPARGELTAEIAGTQFAVPILVGTEARPLDGFEVAGHWTASTVPPGLPGSVSTVADAPHEGRHCLRLEYDFSTGHDTRAVYANTSLAVGQPNALRLWVRGDGGGTWLRARLRDARGHAQVVNFTRRLARLDDWQELTAAISSGLPGPLTLEALYLVEPDPQAQPKGAIELDGLAGDYAPSEKAHTARQMPVNKR